MADLSLMYASAVVIFRITGMFAPRPAHFLEWGRRTRLLRVTGMAYQFRHDSHQRWLTQQSDRPGEVKPQ